MPTVEHHRFYPRDIDIVSIESSNDTESDLPGPGRTLGNLYGYLGRHIERALSTLAERRGLGPHQVALRVIKRDSDLGPFFSIGKYTTKDANEQMKDLKKLVRYTTSKTESTRKQALDSIIDLAIERGHLLEYLKAVNALRIIKQGEPFVWDFCDESLQLRSRVALACVEEGDAYRLVRSYRTSSNVPDTLVDFMRMNPEESFIALRLFNQAMPKIQFWLCANFLEQVMAIHEASPDQVEWEEVDKIFERWFDTIYDRANQTYKKSTFLLQCMIRSSKSLPRTIASNSVQKWIRELWTPEDHWAHYFLELLQRDDFFEHSINDNRGMMDHTFQRFMSFWNTADLALCRIASHWLENIAYKDACVLRTEAIREDCQVLADLIAGEDRYRRHRAIACSRAVLVREVHSRKALLQALRSISFALSPEYSKLLEETRKKCQPGLDQESLFPFWRHCDVRGNLIHVYGEGECSSACFVVHNIAYAFADIVQYECPAGQPVHMPPSLVPISAGRLPDGRRAFLGRARFRVDKVWMSYCSVVEGVNPENMLIRSWRTENYEVPDMLHILALRYAPEAYPRRYGGADFMADRDGGLDATGPYSWKFVGNVSHLATLSLQ